jgi:hypothetical protein
MFIQPKSGNGFSFQPNSRLAGLKMIVIKSYGTANVGIVKQKIRYTVMKVLN